MDYSNRVVRQSKKNFDQDFEDFNKMSLPKNPLKKKNCILKGDELRVKLDQKMSTAGTDLDFLDNELDNIMQGKMNEATSSVLKEIIPSGLVKKFPMNNLSAMVMTGAMAASSTKPRSPPCSASSRSRAAECPRCRTARPSPATCLTTPSPEARATSPTAS